MCKKNGVRLTFCPTVHCPVFLLELLSHLGMSKKCTYARPKYGSFGNMQIHIFVNIVKSFT